MKMTKDELFEKLSREYWFYTKNLLDLNLTFKERRKQFKSWVDNLTIEEKSLIDPKLLDFVFDHMDSTISQLSNFKITLRY